LNLFTTAREWTVSLDSNTELSRGPVEVKPAGITGQVLAELNVGLHPKDAILLNGLGSKFQGDYLVTGVTHRWDLQKGFRTEFTVERGNSR
jgi:phage protein D